MLFKYSPFIIWIYFYFLTITHLNLAVENPAKPILDLLNDDFLNHNDSNEIYEDINHQLVYHSNNEENPFQLLNPVPLAPLAVENSNAESSNDKNETKEIITASYISGQGHVVPKDNFGGDFMNPPPPYPLLVVVKRPVFAHHHRRPWYERLGNYMTHSMKNIVGQLGFHPIYYPGPGFINSFPNEGFPFPPQPQPQFINPNQNPSVNPAENLSPTVASSSASASEPKANVEANNNVQITITNPANNNNNNHNHNVNVQSIQPVHQFMDYSDPFNTYFPGEIKAPVAGVIVHSPNPTQVASASGVSSTHSSISFTTEKPNFNNEDEVSAESEQIFESNKNNNNNNNKRLEEGPNPSLIVSKPIESNPNIAHDKTNYFVNGPPNNIASGPGPSPVGHHPFAAPAGFRNTYPFSFSQLTQPFYPTRFLMRFLG